MVWPNGFRLEKKKSNIALRKQQNFWLFLKGKKKKKKVEALRLSKKAQNLTYSTPTEHREAHRLFLSLCSHLKKCLDTSGEPRNEIFHSLHTWQPILEFAVIQSQFCCKTFFHSP